MNASEVSGVMFEALGKLEQLQQEAALERAWSWNVWGTGSTIDSALVGTRRDIDFLKGELRERVLSPGSFSEGLTGEIAWEAWRDLADSTGQQLARIAGAINKWDMSSTLARVSLDAGQNLAAAARGIGAGLPWVAVGLVALLFLKGRS